MDSSDEKTLMESLDPVIVELLKENVRLRGEIDRLKERLDNKARLMIFQEGYIDKQSQAIKTLKSDKYQKPKYQEKLKEVDDRYKSRIKSLEASYLFERKYKQRPQMTYIISFVSQLKDKNKKYMEEQEKNIQPQRPIINNIYGTVNNLNNGPVTYQGPVTNNNSAAAPAATPKSAYTDEIVSRAIVALNGDNKPIYEKQLFLGICKVLVCKCGWTGKIPAICDRINGLPMAETLQVKCDYKNLKSPSALKFASLEYDEWEDYEPKDMEKVIFKKNKATADAFAEELDKQLYLSQNQS